jgi:F-type H+-transporting ATPase subunit b
MEGFLGLTLPSFIGQLINFLILLGLLTFFGYKPIRRMLDERSNRIKQSMEQAEATKKEYENARIIG